MKPARFIALTKNQREFLRDAFKVTPRMIEKAVYFSSDSELAQRIRTLALQAGGVMMVSQKEVETIHDADGKMKQLLPNGAVLEFDKRTGGCTVWRNGTLMLSYDNVRVCDIETIQQTAAILK